MRSDAILPQAIDSTASGPGAQTKVPGESPVTAANAA